MTTRVAQPQAALRHDTLSADDSKTRRDSAKHILETTIVTAVEKAQATKQFPVPETLDRIIKNPGCPRANIAPSAEHPHGSLDSKRDLSVMQQHVEFFDRNNDGIIYPWETYVGFCAVGFNIFFSLLACFVIHGAFAYPSQDSWIPNPKLPIYVKNIHRCKHGSDSETYDKEGRYIPQKFEELFSKYDRDRKAGLTFREVWNMTVEIREVFDPFGWFANKFEWFTLYLLAAEDGQLKKEDVRRCFDGTLFYHFENKEKAKKAAKLREKEAKRREKQEMKQRKLQ